MILLNYVGNGIIIPHKQEKITSLIESINNGPENYVLADEGDISNYIGFNTKENSDKKFE